MSKKFVFSTNIIFENSFIGNLYFPISKRRPGLINIDGITILQTKTGLFANIEKYRRNQGRNIELYAIGNYHVQPQQETLIVLELNKIHAMFHKIKDLERQKYDNFINIAQYTITFDVIHKVKYILYKIHESDEKVNIKIHNYYYYLDEVNGDLYILAIVSKDANTNDRNKVDFYTFKISIKQSGTPCKIVTYSGPYDTDNFYKRSVNYLDATRALLNNASSKVQLFEIFARLGHNNRIYI